MSSNLAWPSAIYFGICHEPFWRRDLLPLMKTISIFSVCTVHRMSPPGINCSCLFNYQGLKLVSFILNSRRQLRGLVGSDHRSLPPEFESRCGHIWRAFHLRLRFITDLAYRVHKSGCKTPIIIMNMRMVLISWDMSNHFIIEEICLSVAS